MAFLSAFADEVTDSFPGQIKELLVELAGMEYNGFITIEPHLKLGGQFGGDTGPELFSQAVSAVKLTCRRDGTETGST